MKSIRSLTLRNFQRHAKLTIEFDPNITTLVGDTNVGKSSIVRALRWVVTNRPSGDGFIRHGKEKASVSLKMADGTTIKRTKGKEENAYHLNDQEYKAFGQGVPEQCSAVMGLSSVNFQRQHDPYFWLSLSPGDVAKELNEIVDLDSIDSAFAWLASETRRTKAEKEVVDSRLTKAEAEKENLKWSYEAMEEAERLEEMAKEIEEEEKQGRELERVIDSIENAKKTISSLSEPIKEAGKLSKLYQEVKEEEASIQEVDNLLTKLTQTKRLIEVMDKEIKNARLKYDECKGSSCPTCDRPWSNAK